MEPIRSKECSVLGRVVGLFRASHEAMPTTLTLDAGLDFDRVLPGERAGRRARRARRASVVPPVTRPSPAPPSRPARAAGSRSTT